MLDRVEWQDLLDERRMDLLEVVNDALAVRFSEKIVFQPDSIIAKTAKLPFYESGFLLEVDDISLEQSPGPLWFLRYNKSFYPLDGASAPIHDMNEKAGIRLTEETVVDYAHFFCFFVHGDEGPFFVVEDYEFPAIDRRRTDMEKLKAVKDNCKPLELVKVGENGMFELSGVILYGDALFRAVFAVTANGMIEMTDDEPIVAGVSVRKIKPNY